MRGRIAARLVAAGLAGAFGGLGAAVGLGAGAAGASVRLPGGMTVNFTGAAAAPVFQVTEDEPNAQFHPEGEGDYGYTLVTANNTAQTALATVLWPGAAVGNAGTLVSLLGGPTVSALNDPVQASATSGTSQTQSSITAPSGSTMSASVQPQSPTDVHSTATTALAGGGLGAAGSIGSSQSDSLIDFDSSTGVLTAKASSKATNVDIGGVVKIASVTSNASAGATNGGTPKLQGDTLFHDFTIAGQAAYVDGSGVHVGSPGAPAGPAGLDSVDAALAQAGMQIYFTAPHTVTVGGTAYYYAASVLFYWAPPSDPSHNSFTLALGGAAVSVTDSGVSDGSTDVGTGSSTGVAVGSSDSTGSGSAGVPAQDAAASALSPVASPALAGTPASDSSPASGSTGGATLSLPASPSAAADTAGGGSAVPASARLPGGIGAGWWVLAAIAAIAGAGLTTRVPALLNRQAAGVCPRAAKSRSSFGKQKERP